MSSSDTSSADISSQNEAGTVESETIGDGKSKIITEMSLKQLQAIEFLSKIETALENYLKAEQFSDCKEIQNVIKNLAIVLKNGEKEFQQCVIETLNKDDDKVLFQLKDVAFNLFEATIMQGVSLSPQHPLILAYYCISMIDLTEKFVKVGIIHLIVHHLKVMELFMTLTEEDLTLAKLLISILCSCCDLESALTVMVQSAAHHALTYYIHTFAFNTVLLAKSALAVIVNKVEEHFQRFVKLTDRELSQVQAVLSTSVQTKSLNVVLTDRQGPSDYYITGFLEMLQLLATNPDNKLSLGSSIFVGLYHCILVEPELSDATKSVLLLLKAICDHPTNKRVLQQENILATLEMFTDNETLAAITSEVIWAILNEDNPTEIKQVINTDDVKEDKIASVLKTLLSTAKFFFLKNETASQVTKMKFHGVKIVFAEMFCFLRYLMALSEHFTVTVIEKCSSEIQSVLIVISDYCAWMICREMLEWSLMHPLFLFHSLFYFLITICDEGKKQLRDSGVIKLIVKELWMIQLSPKWHRGISKLTQLLLIILLKCFEFIPQELLCQAGLLEQFCIEEEFVFRISAKTLLAAFSKQKSYNFKLVELLESEASNLWNLLKTSSKDPKKVIQVVSHLKDCIILHVSFLEVEFIISSLLRGNPSNRKVLYNCCIHEVVDVLEGACSSIRSKVENLIAFMMDENSSDLSAADLNGSSSATEEYNQVVYWMCRVTTSIRAISSDQVDDNLAEEYVPLEEDSMLVIGLKDLLFSDLFKLTDFSTTQLGIKAFHLFLLQMPQFSILLKSLLKLSFKRIQENNSSVNVPGSSLLRLERTFSLLQDHCQKSSEFCEIIAHRGIIAGLIDGLLVLYACQAYRSIDFEWILLHLAEPILYILAVCAENQSLHAHIRHLPKVLEWYCEVNSERCGALAKISLSMLRRSVPISTQDFELSDPEIHFVFELLSTIVYKQENVEYTWIAYSTNSNDSLYYFITFCLHLVTNSSNAKKLLKAGILDCISFLFQHYKQEVLLKTALQLLAKLSTLVKVSTESHSNMIGSIQQLMLKDSIKLDVFYCLLTLGIDVPKITDLPDGYTDAVAMFRIEQYHDCIDKLQEMIQEKEVSYRIHMIQTLGESYYMLYSLKLSSQRGDKSKHHAKDGDSEHYKYAKQAIKCLGDAYDHQLFIDQDINSMHLDLAMIDCIFHVRDKPLSRCLLCRRKCGRGERLIRSHIWPEALLRHFIDGLPSGSKQMFDPSWKGTGKLEGPGQIHFTMLCKICESLFSKYEKAFKSLCFEKLYRKDTKPHTVTNDAFAMSMVKAPGIPQNWLYLFCLSIAFRMFVIASEGHPTRIIHFKSWYNCFTLWREILLREGSTQHKLVPKIAFFISPVNVMEDLSPPMAKVLFSPGAGAFCSYRLHDGISSSKGEFLLSSVGVINIVVSHDDACFNFIPSECVVTLDSSEFVIPSAIRRYLLFPKGIWRTYKSISAQVTERMLNIAEDKAKAPFNKTWIDKEMKFFTGALGESFDAFHVFLNFLPAPFDKGDPLQQVVTILKSCTAFRVILHTEEAETDIDIVSDHWFNILIIRNNDLDALPELFAVFIFHSKSYRISVAYELSTVDLSVKDVIQPSSTKAFFPQVECYFEVKTLLRDHLVKAVTKAGFTDMALFIRWLKDFKSSSYCDLRCFPYCFACFDVCSCCMRTIPVADAIPIYYDGKVQAKIAIACGSQCYNYLTSTTSMPIILYKPKENVTGSHLVLQACTNGALFGFTDPKGKVIVHYFTSENDNTITVWCQYRLWCTQNICTMLCDDSCSAIADHPTDLDKLLFSDSEGRTKFTQFVKEVWQFYQSLLVKPTATDDVACPQNDQNTVQADEGFQYFATMSTDQLSFHSLHAQSERINQSGQDGNRTAGTV